MPTIKHGNNYIQANDISKEILDAVTPVYPLHQSVVGVMFTNTDVPDGESEHEYLCLLHQNRVTATGTPLTLKEAYSEAAYCSACLTALYVPDGMPEWDTLRDRLCKGDYSQVEVYTNTSKKTATHWLFNALRLLPEHRIPEKLLPYDGDYSAKHAADSRKDEWPNAIWLEPELFEAEVTRRNTCSNCGSKTDIGYETSSQIWICRDCLF